MNYPEIDGLRPGYLNKADGRFRTLAPTEDFEHWEPVLILSADGLDTVALTAETAAWLLPEFAKLVSDYTRWLECESAKSKS